MDKDILKSIITDASYITIGLALGIGLCKFGKPFFLWAIGGIG